MTDERFDRDGVTFVIDKELYEESKPITIDYVETPEGSGFMIQSALAEKSGGCGDCSC